MPIYEYICKKCGARTEVIQKATDKPQKQCKQCGGAVYRPISRTSFQLKGGGWYKDGYTSPSTKPTKGQATTPAKDPGPSAATSTPSSPATASSPTTKKPTE